MRFTTTLKGRITGLTGLILGLYLLRFNWKLALLVISISIGFILWRFKK